MVAQTRKALAAPEVPAMSRSPARRARGFPSLRARHVTRRNSALMAWPNAWALAPEATTLARRNAQ